MRIPLNHGLFAIIDDIDYPLISQYKWYAKHSAYSWYAVCGIKENNKVKHIRMHRLIMGCESNQVVHHINGNTLDNRRCNLVVCTQRQNLSYRICKKSNTKYVVYRGLDFLGFD